MCGSLRLEGLGFWVSIGAQVHASNFEGQDPYGKGSYEWNGFARTDGSRDGRKTLAQQWPPSKWTPVIIKSDRFTERHKDGREHVFRASRLAGLVGIDGSFKILTRPARTPDEQAVHPRMPSQVPSSWNREQYVEKLNERTGGKYE